jgi:hypothetical protein
MHGSQRRERMCERFFVLAGTDGNEKDRIGIETKRQSRRPSLAWSTRLSRYEGPYGLDTPRAAGTRRLILPGSNSRGGGDSIDQEAGNDPLFRP